MIRIWGLSYFKKRIVSKIRSISLAIGVSCLHASKQHCEPLAESAAYIYTADTQHDWCTRNIMFRTKNCRHNLVYKLRRIMARILTAKPIKAFLLRRSLKTKTERINIMIAPDAWIAGKKKDEEEALT